MTEAPQAGWLGRTFGWSGSRAQWLGFAVGAGWIAGLVLLAYLTRNASLGVQVFSGLGWLLLLGLLARDAVRDLFGPVFFYDLLRVSRNRFTFVLRGLYVLAIGGFLALFYFGWILDHTRHDYNASGEICASGAAVALIVGFGLFFAGRGRLHLAVRIIVLVVGLILAVILTVAAFSHFASAVRYDAPGNAVLPSSVVSKFATTFFTYFVVLQFIVMALLTPVYVAATIAVEKERKTLEFLLATDLRNREIVFGKLASRVLTLVMYVLAGLPLMAFLQLFGGIDPEQLLAATVATLVMVLGLSALAIWVSTTLRRARDAIVITYLLALTYGFVSILLASLTNAPWGFNSWWNTPVSLFGFSVGLNDAASFLADGNPLWGVIKMQGGMAMGLTSGVGQVLREFVVFWGLAIALLLLSAILKVRRVALDQAYGGQRVKRAPVHPKAAGGSKAGPRRVETGNPIVLLVDGTAKRPPITGNPVTWKEVFVDSTFRTGCLGRVIAGVIIVLTVLPFLLITYFQFFDPYRASYYYRPFPEMWQRYTEEVNSWVRVVTGVLGALMFFAAAIRGAGAVSGERDRDTWLSLTSTPLSVDEILWGKFWGCVFGLRRAFCVLLVVWMIGLATGSVMPAMIPVMLLLTAVYVSAFSLLGIYCSIAARTTLIASVRAFFAALFCAGGHWIALGICCFAPLSMSRTHYSTVEKLQTFFLGFTPPFVYGVFPLRDFDLRDLGPFEATQHSSGMLGPVVGTLFWIAFSLILASRCRAKLREITHRSNRPPRRREDGDRDAAEPRNDGHE